MDHTEVDPPDPAGGVAVEPVEPAEPPPYKHYALAKEPLLSWGRLLRVALVVLAVGFLVYAFTRPGSGSDGTPTDLDPAIVRLDPTPGSRVLRQSQLSVVLQDGWDGRMVVNGVEIPEDQMLGAIPVTSKEYDPSLGPRPNHKNLVGFKPGPGKAVSGYETGEVNITVRFWPIDRGPKAARTFTYAIDVT